MKILVSALACNPAWGSEASVGWSIVSTLAKRHEVWVLVHAVNRGIFEQISEPLPGNIHLHFLGQVTPPHPNRMLARIESWRENYRWQRALLRPAKALHQEIQFDVVHHVTYATWRVASPLWQLGIPFVWGPLGGGELFPWKAKRILSPATLFFELLRSASNFASRQNDAVRDCARNAAVCIAGNRETFRILRVLRGRDQGLASLPGGPLANAKIEGFKTLVPKKSYSGPLRFFAGGNLEGRKGVAIALQALAGVQSRIGKFSYRLGGGGPELGHLQRLAGALGIAEKVTFGEGFQGEEYRVELMRTHIYLLPSLRDNAPRTLMEAMLAGCVPIVADCGGPGEIVTDECGFRVPVSEPEEMAAKISEIIQALDSDRDLLHRLGMAAHQRIVSTFSEDRFLEQIEAIYQEGLQTSGRRAARPQSA